MKSDTTRRFLLILLEATLIAALVRLLTRQPSLSSKSPIEPLSEQKPEINTLDEMPIKLGAKRIAFQLNTFLPQVHLTLISVLQGLALSVLIVQFDVVSPLSFPTIILYIDSLIVISLVWHLYAIAFIAFIWPLSALHTILQFFLAAMECFSLAFISNPPVWTLGIAVTAFIGSLIRWLNTQVVTPAHYERTDMHISDVEVEKRASRKMLFLGAASLVQGATLLIADWQQYIYFEHLVFIVGLIIGISIIWELWDNKETAIIQRHLENSPWSFKNRQLVEREMECQDKS